MRPKRCKAWLEERQEQAVRLLTHHSVRKAARLLRADTADAAPESP